MIDRIILMAGRLTAETADALRPLLKLIYSGEGGYTSVNRGKAGDTPGGAPELVTLTLAQVKARQAAGKWFAVGAPQFIPDTLEIAQTDAGLSDSDLFSPENQDILAAALLIGSKRPKLAAYLKGKTSAIGSAQEELAYEWASLPLPNGKGAYDGDSAGNRASAEVKAVQAALLAARKALVGLYASAAIDAPSVTLEQPAAATAPPKGADQTPPPKVAIQTITALLPTWLKKKPVSAEALPSNQKKEAPAGVGYGVVAVREIPQTAHVEVDLAAGAGTWVIWQPHWSGFSSPPSYSSIDKEINWADFSAAITPHLTVGEVLQFDHRRRPPAGSADIGRIMATAAAFEAVRVAWGSPLGITSFYRPEPINREVGGVSNSRHISGSAMDVYPIGRGLQEFYLWIRHRWTGGLGDGRPKGFIHLDTRNGGGFVPGGGRGPAAEWTY